MERSAGEEYRPKARHVILSPFGSSSIVICLFVLETIRTGAMRVIHIPVKTEETQRLRIKFVLYCPICALDLKIKRANFCRKKMSNVQCPFSGPHVQQSLLRHTQVFHLRENKMGTSPVSSTSTSVEHGGIGGKWMMQLSLQVSVPELTNTKDLLQRQNSVGMP